MLGRIKKILGIPDPIPADDIKWIIKPFLPEDPIILEAGAHIGWDTGQMARIWPKGKIHAFEPIPDVLNRLRENCSRYRNVAIYDYALSSKEGESEIFISSGRSNASSSLLKPKETLNVHPDVLFNSNVVVKTIPIEKWAEKNGVKKIDFFWLDLQGSELDVIKTAGKILDTVKVIYTEVNLLENYEGAGLYPELKSYLQEKGFKIEKEGLDWEDAGNVLFVKK